CPRAQELFTKLTRKKRAKWTVKLSSLFSKGGLRLGANGNLSPPSAPRISQMVMVRRALAVRAPQLPTVAAPLMCPVPIQTNAWMLSAQTTTFWGTLMGCLKRKPPFSLILQPMKTRTAIVPNWTIQAVGKCRDFQTYRIC
ncbi:hypothetical protein NXF25_006096, partial [Crotalus adamanteus]